MRELAADPAYDEQILPLALEMLSPFQEPLIDLGCGEGRLMRAVGEAAALGCDVSLRLLGRAAGAGHVIQARLPDLSWLRSGSMGSAAAVFVVEHIADIDAFFGHVARVLHGGGVFALVMNHPAYTPHGAGPLIDTSDGEVLWRWGEYFEEGVGLEPAGEGAVAFHHRPLGRLLSAAATAGFRLERLTEAGLAPSAVAANPALVGQEHLPRILAARWRKEGRP